MAIDILKYLGAAFLGGVILNVMPCVLPVLTMKVFHLIEAGQEDAAANRRHGVAYTAGILLTFVGFAALVVAIRASGELVGWGMQFQNPSFVAFLSGLMAVLALNAFGVFQISITYASTRRRSGDDGDYSGGHKSGYLSSVGNGVVASLISTPCSAPFLGSAAAFALGAETAWWVTLLIFVGVGFGLASPFLLVSFVPAIGRLLPRPGLWMQRLKSLMGFTLLAAAVWLFGVLMQQVSLDSAKWFLGFMVVVSTALWAVNAFGGFMASTARRIVVRVVVVVVVAAAGIHMLRFDAAVPSAPAASGLASPVVVNGAIHWTPFSPFRISLANHRQRPVFVDYTADWCLNCKTNEKLFIETEEVRERLLASDLLPMKADWTNADEKITRSLDKLGRSSIPTYAIFVPGGEVDLLPEVITEELLLERLAKAANRFPKEKYLPVAEACALPGGS